MSIINNNETAAAATAAAATATTYKAPEFPGAHINGKLAADPVLRFLPAKEGKEAVAVLEFRVILNPTNPNMEAVGITCQVYGTKRAEALKDKLAKGTSVEVSGDLISEAYADKETHEPRASIKLSVSYGKVVTFEDKKPVKTSFFAKEVAEQQQ